MLLNQMSSRSKTYHASRSRYGRRRIGGGHGGIIPRQGSLCSLVEASRRSANGGLQLLIAKEPRGTVHQTGADKRFDLAIEMLAVRAGK
jgi:hypothetical protein